MEQCSTTYNNMEVKTLYRLTAFGYQNYTEPIIFSFLRLQHSWGSHGGMSKFRFLNGAVLRQLFVFGPRAVWSILVDRMKGCKLLQVIA